MITSELLQEFLSQQGKEALFVKFFKFFHSYGDSTYNETVTKEILSNLKFKHEFAKFLVNRAITLPYHSIPNDIIDERLQSFINYYAWTYVLSHDVTNNQIEDLLLYKYHIGKGCYLKGNTISGDYPLDPVRMRPGDFLFPGYRLFIVNTLCFACNTFMLGIRADSGPVCGQQYYKACRPIEGVHEDAQGRKWTLFNVDVSTSDDHTAIFGNGLDGDGTVEICDYINDKDVRIIFRSNY